MTIFAPHTGFSFLEVNQAQKEVTANAALLTLDALLNTGALSIDVATPPISPLDGDVYIIGSSALGEWAGKENAVVWYHTNYGWTFITPNEGLTLWVNDKNKLYSFDGTSWELSVDTRSTNILGVNAVADNINRISATTPAVLLNAETDDIQLKLNKAAAGDNASVIFQTGFSGRAEFGLTGDDDFHMKVSPDGATFYDAIVIDADTGFVDLPLRLPVAY